MGTGLGVGAAAAGAGLGGGGAGLNGLRKEKKAAMEADEIKVQRVLVRK
ncbi:hypothetical protein [Hymenobacter sp. AT01-02]|nr:hypothetical protein [Hymenobacter sp. AT01-02]